MSNNWIISEQEKSVLIIPGSKRGEAAKPDNIGGLSRTKRRLRGQKRGEQSQISACERIDRADEQRQNRKELRKIRKSLGI